MYYKANKKVAEYLQLTAERNETRDGNYILWVADINRFGSLANIDEILANIGAVAIHPKDVRNELLGITNTPLPTPLDEKFVIETAEIPADESTEGLGVSNTDNTDNAQAEVSESEAESAPEEESQADVAESTSEYDTTNQEEE